MLKHLISIDDLTVSEILLIFKRAKEMKKRPYQDVLKNKNLAMLFAKPSTRTRVSFEVAMNHLGGHALDLDFQNLQVSRGETLGDTARVLGRYVNCVMARLFRHQDLLELANNSPVPVINGLTDLLHPCQVLSDMFTLHEKLGKLMGLKITYVGDGNNNVTHSLMYACSKLRINLSVGCPKGYNPNPGIMRKASKNARRMGCKLEVLHDPKKAVNGADVLYTDTWVSMGKKPSPKTIRELRPFQVNDKLLSMTKKNALAMHCLPAHGGREITSKVMDGRNSIIFDQAENRLHVEKAILALLMG